MKKMCSFIHMLMWYDHSQLHLLLKCIVTYDKKLGCIHVTKICPLDLDKDCPLNDVHVVINNNLNSYNNK